MLMKKVTIINKDGKVVREPTMDALKKFSEDPTKNESDADEEAGEIRGEETPSRFNQGEELPKKKEDDNQEEEKNVGKYDHEKQQREGPPDNDYVG
jgi:ABC-type multidrug transport system ATPase subunit